jgi:hypothetical protein
MARLARLNTEATYCTCAEDVDGDPGPRHEADGQAGQTKQHTFLQLTLYFHQGYGTQRHIFYKFTILKMIWMLGPAPDSNTAIHVILQIIELPSILFRSRWKKMLLSSTLGVSTTKNIKY